MEGWDATEQSWVVLQGTYLGTCSASFLRASKDTWTRTRRAGGRYASALGATTVAPTDNGRRRRTAEGRIGGLTVQDGRGNRDFEMMMEKNPRQSPDQPCKTKTHHDF